MSDYYDPLADASLATFPIKDEYMLYTVQYLANKLNAYFNPFIAVNTFVDYNSYNTATSGYPLLKCYRVQDNFLTNMGVSSTLTNVEYAIILPKQDELGAISSRISSVINMALVDPAFYDTTGIKIDRNNPITTSYRLSLDDEYKALVGYVTVSFNIYTSI